MTPLLPFLAATTLLLAACQTGAQTTPQTAPQTDPQTDPTYPIALEGHQPAHPMRRADGSPRTLPDGTAIQLAGGTFQIVLEADGRVAVTRHLDDGRRFAYEGTCQSGGDPLLLRCSASDGVGVPLQFALALRDDWAGGEYRSQGYDPAFGLERVEAE